MNRVTQRSARLTSARALQRYCRKCGALPGDWCTYVRFTELPVGDKRIGKVTRRLHFERTENTWWKLRHWLKENYSIFEVVDEAQDGHK